MPTVLREAMGEPTVVSRAICTNLRCGAVMDDGLFHSDCPECGSLVISACPRCGAGLPADCSKAQFCSGCGKFLLLVAVGVAALYSDPTFRYWIWLVAALVLLGGWYLGTAAHLDTRRDPDARTIWVARTCSLIGTYLLVVCIAEMLLAIITVLCTGQIGRLQDFLH
jgi:hypothetical protein